MPSFDASQDNSTVEPAQTTFGLATNSLIEGGHAASVKTAMTSQPTGRFLRLRIASAALWPENFSESNIRPQSGLISPSPGSTGAEGTRFVQGGSMKKTFEQISHLVNGCTRTALQLTRREMFRKALVGGAAVTGASLLSINPEARADSGRHDDDDASTSLVPAAAGGPVPSSRNALSVRWLGCSCFELVYRDQVILLDTWYDRPLCRDIGLTPSQVIRANVILIGHAHFDHIADAASIALRTGAIVIAD